MRAMVLDQVRQPLTLREAERPQPGPNQVLVRVLACGVCRTDLHVVDGDLTDARLPIIPGHQIVGVVEEVGLEVTHVSVGTRIGIPWLGSTCGSCAYCESGRENLCDSARFTGYQIDGGFAEFAVADARFCFEIPPSYDPIQAAPLLCAGLIGFRSYRMAGDGLRIGLYGFGAAAHIVAQIAVFEGREVYAFTRPGDLEAQEFARSLGAVWAADSLVSPPQPLDAAIIFAPVGQLVPTALRAVSKGATVVCAGIHMSDIPSFDYATLWGERVLRSVANLTRADGTEFFDLAPRVPVRAQTQTYSLEQANEALGDLRSGRVRGAAVLEIRV